MNDKVLRELQKSFKGEVYTDNILRTVYATDASAYQEKPEAVIIAKDNSDLKAAITFANKYNKPIIPRAAGTSLAGQVVGNGIVVDCSKYMNQILEINKKEKWVKVQPGVVLDELNKELKQYNLFFGPETSTSNRCMMGGMVGNNSCGAHSLIYGSTREHTLEIEAILSDGSEVTFKSLTENEFKSKCQLTTLEGDVYRFIDDLLSKTEVQKEIEAEFPEPDLERRNTGYALDMLLRMKPFNNNGKEFNMCALLCGSEGTLALTKSIKLNLVELPPKERGLLVIHHNSLEESFEANIIALRYKPGAIELMDDVILDCTKNSLGHKNNRFFMEGSPKALLCVEFARNSKEEIEKLTSELTTDLQRRTMGYAYPVLYGKDISKVWSLRKAGLGLLSNIPGDAKPQPVIEDTAVKAELLPAYMADFREALKKRNLECVFYAHIATGELHLRPVLNLKSEEGQKQFRLIAEDIAKLVKKYRGSLSGEHGDGRLRGEFVKYMVGERNYALMEELKHIWDPKNLLNPGKIVNAPAMDQSLRYTAENNASEPETIFSFEEAGGMLRLAEKCNGSADCRKSHIIGGTMCPTYQATRDEDKTTRARANMLREIMTQYNQNWSENEELASILDLCISCKGCKRECPSGVDMAKLKAEFLYQRYRKKGFPFRSKMIASFATMQRFASNFAGLYNAVMQSQLLSAPIKKALGFASKRSIPKVYRKSFYKWAINYLRAKNNVSSDKQLYFYIDEFSNYNEREIAEKSLKLLIKLGYHVKIHKSTESGRAYISKGLLHKAKILAEQNVSLYSNVIKEDTPLVGVEPSAILTFRDEYADLLRGNLKEKAQLMAKYVLTFEEFLANEISTGKIKQEQFHNKTQKILYHGHCQQKALTGTQKTIDILSFPENYQVEEIASGCCGMAGSFGYEKEHFALSNKIAELVLLPAVREANADNTIICASGTSCRHQIWDGAQRKALHPLEVLYDALI